MANFDDEVPPLEDMSELLEQVHKLHSDQKSSTQTTSSKSTATRDVASSKSTATRDLAEATQQNSVTIPRNCATKKQNATHQQTTSSPSFGGMKKGFLFGSSSKPKSAKKSSSAVKSGTISSDSTQDIPLIKPKITEGKGERQHEIAEVQQALKASTPLLQNTEWVTDDLLKQLEQHPRLLRQLSDPRISQAMAKFQKNPQLAMQEYQNNPEIQQFFKDFCGILGSHFDSLGANNNPQSSQPQATKSIHTQDNTNRADIRVHSSTNPNQATAADEVRMKQILSDPKTQEVLRDGEIQKLFTVLRSDPGEAQRMLQKLGPSGKEKVQRLVDAGLLGFSSR